MPATPDQSRAAQRWLSFLEQLDSAEGAKSFSLLGNFSARERRKVLTISTSFPSSWPHLIRLLILSEIEKIGGVDVGDEYYAQHAPAFASMMDFLAPALTRARSAAAAKEAP